MGEIELDQTLLDTFRPVPGGVQATSPGCTLGYNVNHYLHGRSFVTNSHCTTNLFAYDGVMVPQPRFGSRIGEEVLDPVLFSGGSCPSGYYCRWSDAALVKYDDEIAYELGTIVQTTGLSSITVDTANPRFFVSFSYDSWCWEQWGCTVEGDSINKVGATTGWTAGVVDGTCASVLHAIGVVMLCQHVATYHSLGGDSGSPVFSLDNAMIFTPNYVAAYGIHWGRSDVTGLRFYSPIHGVRKDLGNASQACSGLRITYGPYATTC